LDVGERLQLICSLYGQRCVLVVLNIQVKGREKGRKTEKEKKKKKKKKKEKFCHVFDRGGRGGGRVELGIGGQSKHTSE